MNSSCGWIGDADTNASKVIALLGGCFVNQPEGSWLFCSLGEAAGGLLKASSSA